jgi:carboxyl-terminal processing protease
MNTMTRQAVSYALVAVIAFGAGAFIFGHSGNGSVVSQLPFIGSTLNATPDAAADLTPFWEEWNALQANYVITHASTTIPTTDQMIQGAMQGLAASYGDPYTLYFPPTQAAAFNQNISGNFGGVGLEIDDNSAGVLTVTAPLKGTPGAAAGVKAGDEILFIDGTSTEGMSTDQAVADIRGPIGSVVTLTLLRAGTQFKVNITRATIEVPESDDGPVVGAPGVYKIALYEFTADSADLFDAAWARFKASGDKELIIDLRENPGGYLDAAVHIAGHFLPKGTTVVTEDYGGKQPSDVNVSAGPDDVPAGTKVVVLVDGGSASASEILAGALQDNHAATIIGTQSFGKGSVQQVIDIGQGELKVTVARWLTPAGHWIMGNGITPDIKVAAATTTPATALDDPQIARAVQFLTTGK